jgi:hypothetical protein
LSKKPNRKELTQKVIRLAKLSTGKATSGYMTREQLSQLIVFLEHCMELLDTKEEKKDGEART